MFDAAQLSRAFIAVRCPRAAPVAPDEREHVQPERDRRRRARSLQGAARSGPPGCLQVIHARAAGMLGVNAHARVLNWFVLLPCMACIFGVFRAQGSFDRPVVRDVCSRDAGAHLCGAPPLAAPMDGQGTRWPPALCLPLALRMCAARVRAARACARAASRGLTLGYVGACLHACTQASSKWHRYECRACCPAPRSNLKPNLKNPKPKPGIKQMAKVVVQSVLLGSSFVLWAGGLLLCGPATTVMLEYTEVMLLRLGRSVSSRAVRGRSARLVMNVIQKINK